MIFHTDNHKPTFAPPCMIEYNLFSTILHYKQNIPLNEKSKSHTNLKDFTQTVAF